MRREATGALPLLFVAAVVAIGFVLRGPIIATAPVIGDIRVELGFTAAQAGLLTSLPVLCFALATPVASLLIARAGADLATTLALLGVVLGGVVRSAGDATATIVGTVLMGVFLTIGNVVVPVLIRRDVPAARVRTATAFYTSSLIVGSVVATVATAPLAEAVGWRASLAVWAAVVALVLAVWCVADGRRAFAPERRMPSRGSVASSAPASAVRRDRVTAGLLAVGFAGQAFGYYGLTAWLPTLLEDELGFDPTAAGGGASVFQLAGLIGAIGVPLLARSAGLPVVGAVMGALWLVVPLGLLVAPEGWLAWSLVGGAAQGAGITFAFIAVVEIARDDGHARRVSAVMQGVGYGLGGATAPTVLGAVHDATASWSLPLVLVAAALVVFGTLSVATVVRARHPERVRPG